MGMRKKFRVPDPDIEPQRTLEDILGPVKLPARKREKVIPPTPVKSLPMAAVLAGAPPTATVQKASSLPKPSPVVEDEEEYSDEDLMHLILMLIP
jgi:hypothetical protein